LDGGAWTGGCQASRGSELLLILFFVFLFFVIFEKVSVFTHHGLFLLVFVIVVLIIGDDVEVHGMRLRDLELRLAFGAAEDLAFFDFVFIDIDFGGTFRAADQGSILRRDVRKAGVTRVASATMKRIIYRGV
jgi:hypothetical protein